MFIPSNSYLSVFCVFNFKKKSFIPSSVSYILIPIFVPRISLVLFPP